MNPNGERIETARSLLRRLLNKTWQRLNTLYVHIVVGRPIDEIIQFARISKTDLIIMASHGEPGLKQRCLSATTERVARRAPCSVLVVPEG